MSNRLSAVMGLLVLAWTGSAWALGLGEIEAKSHLNQPLLAHIAISSSTPAEVESLVVALASNEDFDRAGLERPEYLSTLVFEVQGATIRVRSKEIARSPFVTFLLDLRWKGGRLLREYTLLLDPPTLAQGAAAPARPAVAIPKPTAASPEPVAAVTVPATPSATPSATPTFTPEPAVYSAAPAAAVPAARDGTYGPVEPRETLWSIAYRLRPDADAITMDQMQVALLNANPDAFKDGDLTGLLKGVTLRIPSRAEILAVDPAAAKSQVARARSGAAAPARIAPVAQATTKPVPKVEPKPEPKSEPKPEPPPVAQVEPAPAPVPTPKETVKSDPVPAPAASLSTSPPAVAAAPTSVPAPPPSEPVTATASSPEPEAVASEPIESRPEAPESAPNPAAAPVIKKPKYEVEWTGFLDRGKELVGPYALPAIAGILVLAGGLFGFRRLRDKYAQWSYNRASRKQSKSAATDAGMDATEIAGDSGAADSDATAIHPAMVSTVAMHAVAHDATQSMDARMAATMQQPTKSSSMDQTMRQEASAGVSAARAVDFDVTGQYASETVQINLDAGDPVSEAEFHRAYGLYDEAALLLKQALVKDPQRTEARVKLAEIYFEASKPTEFIAVATELKSQLPDAEWQKVALMGSQIAPQEALFSGATLGAAGAAVDLSFDEPAAPATPAAAPARRAPAAADPDMLDFKLDDAMESAPAAQAAEDSLEFDLGGLSLDEPATAKPGGSPAAPAEEFKMDSLDLGDFDLGESAGADSGSMEVDSGTGDDASTKLDLARAYVDMGDNDMAKGLLNEVLSQGTDQQKKEAGELLRRVQA